MLGSLSLQDAQKTSSATWPLVRVRARLFFFFFILIRRFLPPHFSILDSDFLKQIRFSCPPLPTDWYTLPGSEGIIFSGDVTVSIPSRLKAKILVFRDLAALQRFWQLGLGHRKPPDDTVRAVVNDLSSIVTFHPPKVRIRNWIASEPPWSRGDDIRYHGMKLLLDAGISTSTCLFIPIMEVFQFGLPSPLSHAAAEKLHSEIKSISFPYQVEIQASDEIPSPI